MNPRTLVSRPRHRGRTASLLLALALGAGLLLTSLDASAARLGGGRASGMYRPHVTRTAPVSPAPAGTQRQGATQAEPRAGAAQPAPATPRRNAWLGPLAGLAAGIGLGALFAHLGLAPALGSWLLVLLLAVAGFALLRMISRGARSRGAAAAGTPWQGAGAGAPAWNDPAPAARAAQAPAPSWSSPPAGSASGDAFDTDGFLQRARDVFMRLQQANDRGDLHALQDATTPDLFEQFRRDLIRRGEAAQSTEVLSLQADMLEHVEHPSAELASVRFSGLLREQAQAGSPETFDEVWHFTRPSDRSTGWLLAGIQPMA